MSEIVKKSDTREKITLPLLISEIKSGKTVPQIAKAYGYTDAGIYEILTRNGFSIKALQAYKEQKADLLAFKQSQIVNAMTPKKIKEASLRDQATTLGILHNAERLERGQSTDNVSFASITRELGELEAEEARLRKLMIEDEKKS